jgi:hypothetical protein
MDETKWLKSFCFCAPQLMRQSSQDFAASAILAGTQEFLSLIRIGARQLTGLRVWCGDYSLIPAFQRP